MEGKVHACIHLVCVTCFSCGDTVTLQNPRSKTAYIFSKTAKGGIQQVIAKDKTDAGQIRLIREHLSEIAAEFSQGDFSKPTQIHGNEMSGLAELRMAKPDPIQIGCPGASRWYADWLHN